MNLKTLFAATLFAMPMVSIASAADPFTGDWNRDCGGRVGCDLVIEKKSKDEYTVKFEAVSFVNGANKTFCEKTLTLKRDKGINLVGSDGKTPIKLTLAGGDLKSDTKLKCGKFKVGGTYFPIGDY